MFRYFAFAIISVRCIEALDNGVARSPPLGYSNWNYFHNKINASIFHDTAKFMKDNGFLEAGYNYITLGGIGYANGSTPGGNITRNASGHMQVDPIRFPGGNEGMRKLIEEIISLGFKWGSYTEAGEKACNGANGTSEGFEELDAKLFIDDWKSEYIMIDSCGIVTKPPPYGPPPDYPGGQARWEMTLWKNILANKQKQGHKPVLIHDCHNGCTTTFSGTTLAALPCNASDSSQHWYLPLNGDAGGLVDGSLGFCAGCGIDPPGGCANDAGKYKNGTGYGLGMTACIVKCSNNDDPRYASKCGSFGIPEGIGKMKQMFNYTTSDGTIRNMEGGSCLEINTQQQQIFNQVIGGEGRHRQGDSYPPICNKTSQQWDVVKLPTGNSDYADAIQFRSRASSDLCLSSAGGRSPFVIDPWCIANNNIWRSSTDVLQVWTRVMNMVDSMATVGEFSRPGAWTFPDCLEIGVPGDFTLTWEETKSNLALFAVTSSPLFLGNDPRPGRMQKRLIELLLNPDMLSVNQQYNQKIGYAGGRLWSALYGKELWAKPLVKPTHSVAVVLFNRAGTVIGEVPKGTSPLPPYCHNSTSQNGPCTGCFLDYDKPWLSPCNDNVTASVGAQLFEFYFNTLPHSWIGLTDNINGIEKISCDIYDIFATAAEGALLGRFTDSWSATIPPHGVRFLRLSNCQ